MNKNAKGCLLAIAASLILWLIIIYVVWWTVLR